MSETKGQVVIKCCKCQTQYSFVEGIRAYEREKTENQEKVMLWLENRDVKAWMLRCPNCGIVHLMTVFLFDKFFEKVFLSSTKMKCGAEEGE